MSEELNLRQSQVDDYLLGKLSPEESEAFEIFLFGNPDFLQEVRLREQMINLIKEEREDLIADYQTQKFGKKKIFKLFSSPRTAPWIYAAAAVVALLLVILITPNLKDDAAPDPANFKASPFLESQIGGSFRTSGISVSVSSPENGENFEGSIMFEWEAKENGTPYTGSLDLKIMNNKQDVVFQMSVNKREFLLDQQLEAGVYYWTLEKNSDMIYLGKFYVNKP